MYEILENVIKAGGYKLLEMQHKIKKLYVQGDVDEAQMDELLTMTMQNANADAERPEYIAMLRAFSSRLDELAARIAALEQSESPAPPEGEYESWQAWDGVSDKYQPGAIVQHKGKTWISTHPGQNVWEPGVSGTERAWSLYEGGAM